jgi:ComF family protein
VRAAGLYEGPLREALHRFKYGGRRSLALPLAGLLADLLEGPDFASAGLVPPVPVGVKVASSSSGSLNWVIVPVPLSTDRLRERGFNQAALLARELSRRLGVPAAESVLVKSRDTAPQVGLSRREREVNLAGAFAVPDASVVKGKNILLIDDVFTTGSTLSAASSVLLRAGSGQVFGLVLAAGWLI